MRLGADLMVRSRHDRAQVLPRIRSGFTLGEKLDIQTLMSLPDWNAETGSSRAAVDTKFRLTAPMPFVDRFDARIRQLPSGVSRETTVVFRSPIAFVDRLQGRLRQLPDGVSRYSMEFGFPEVLTNTGAQRPTSLTGGATLEEIAESDRPDIFRLGMQMVFAGSASSGLATSRASDRYKVILRYEQETGNLERRATSLAYDHSWAIRDLARIEFNLKLLRRAVAVDTTLGFNWQAEF